MPRSAPSSDTPHLWILPAKQQRSMQTRDRLLAAGQQLLDKGGFDETSIAALAQQAGCSVGSFYSRFHDKEAFYQAVLVSMEAYLLQRMQSEVNTATVAQLSAAATVEACLNALLGMFSDHAGLLRTMQRKNIERPQVSVPLQSLGQALIAHMVGLIAARYGESSNPAFQHNLGVGFQIAFAICINGVMNHPPLLNPESRDYRFWIREVVMHALSVRHAPPPAQPVRLARHAA